MSCFSNSVVLMRFYQTSCNVITNRNNLTLCSLSQMLYGWRQSTGNPFLLGIHDGWIYQQDIPSVWRESVRTIFHSLRC